MNLHLFELQQKLESFVSFSLIFVAQCMVCTVICAHFGQSFFTHYPGYNIDAEWVSNFRIVTLNNCFCENSQAMTIIGPSRPDAGQLGCQRFSWAAGYPGPNMQ